MPFDQLLVKVVAVLGSHEWRLGEDVLDLCCDLAEFDVLNERNYPCMLSDHVLSNIS